MIQICILILSKFDFFVLTKYCIKKTLRYICFTCYKHFFEPRMIIAHINMIKDMIPVFVLYSISSCFQMFLFIYQYMINKMNSDPKPLKHSNYKSWNAIVNQWRHCFFLTTTTIFYHWNVVIMRKDDYVIVFQETRVQT